MVEKSKLDEDKKMKAVDPSHYHGMIGTLLYLTASRPDLQFAICICARTRDTTIDQQAAMDEALVPHAQILRIGRINFRLLSDIKSKESTLQLVYDVLCICPFFKAFLVTADLKTISSSNSVRFTPQENVDYAYLMWEDFVYQVEHKNSKKSNKMYYPRFTKVIIYHFMSKDPSIPRRNKVNWHYVKDDHMFSIIKLTHISQASSFGTDEGTGSILGVLDAPTYESEEELSWNSTDDEGADDEGKDGDDDEEDGGDDGKEGDGDDDDEDDDGEEGHVKEEEEDKLYRDVNINQGRGIQATLEVEDSHVTLTPVNLDGMESIFETTSQMDTQTPTSVAPLPMTTPTMTPSTIATITTTSQAQILPKTMNEAVKVAVQIQTDRLRNKAQRENDEFLKSAVNEQLEAEVLTQSSHSSKTSYAIATDLSDIELNKILIEKMEGNKSIQRSDEQRNLYKALVEAYESDKIILDTYGNTVTLKRRRDDDADKDKNPPLDQTGGSKRRREGKEPESASAPTETATRSTGRSTQMSQSRQASHPERFSQQQKPPSPDRDWNKTVPAIHESIQPSISELAKQFDSRSSFNELMDTSLDFSNFLINRLKGVAHWGRKHQQFYGFAVNQESACDVYSKRKIIVVTELKIVEWHNYKHLDWITVQRDDDNLYKFKEGNFKRLRIQDIEDMLLILVQRKLTNLTVEERFAFNVSL
nr:hypothetical protein [Tanacetum cinerariifolium]